MAVSGICFSPSKQRPLVINHHFSEHANLQIPKTTSNDTDYITRCPILSKRSLNLSIVAVIISVSLSETKTHIAIAEEAAAEAIQLERYTDFKEGFTLLKPSSYLKIDKAGATVLFEEVSKGSNNVGVVVSPVRLMSLRDFGSPQFVADKLIQAEKRKESTKDVQLVRALDRTGQHDLAVYEFEYKVDSTRGGMKRIFSAAFVSEKKLYLLNIAHADKPDDPLDIRTRTMLEEVQHSFDTVST